jgi:hypothetical protein
MTGADTVRMRVLNDGNRSKRIDSGEYCLQHQSTNAGN